MLTLKSCENKGHLQDPGYTSALEKMRKKCYHMQILHLQFLHLRIYEIQDWIPDSISSSDDVTNVTVIWSGRKKITFIAGLIK